MISSLPITSAIAGTSSSPATSTIPASDSSNVIALRNASSWSASSCWMNLSPMPTWRRNISV